VVDTIVATADQLDVDLIVMATEGRHGFLDALRGSTTEAVLRRAGRPLLAVPA
jgi:nucleotide-binding universal stress UspA family protein